MVRTSAGEKTCFGAAWVAFCAMAVLPIVYMLVLSVRGQDGFTLEAYASVLRDGRQWMLLRNSLAIAFGTALVSILLGAPAGFALEYLRIPTRRILTYLLIVPLLIPPYVAAVAWIDLLGRQGILSKAFGGSPIDVFSVAGVILVLSLSYFPLVALTTGLAVRRVDRRLEEAAELTVTKTRTLLGVTVPLLIPGVLAGGLFVFLLSLVNFGVPSLLQVNVYPVEVYTRFNAFHDFRGATAVAVPLLAVVVLLVAGWTLRSRRRRFWLSDSRRRAITDVRTTGWSWLATILCWLLACVCAIGPLSVLVARSLPVSSYVHAWKTAKGEIGNSIAMAAGTATVLVLLGFCLSYWMRRQGRVRSAFLRSWVLAPFVISGPVLGIGLIMLWNRSGPFGVVYGSAAIVVLACAARYVFFAEEGIGVALRNIHINLEEAASVAGVAWWRRLKTVVVPLLAPSLVAAWGVGFVLAFQELDATVLVCPPGFTTLPVRLFTLMHYGPNRLVMALCVLIVGLIVVSAALTAMVYARTRRFQHAPA